ncbi:uncharacterized protein LOC136090922 [Hydra vulgaris]|uniref:Uncharacterized protein LOC136090922 n=1 Tax=Hydra vulgaris TaxID=6087 RepID=A0ABM4DHK6_HYDVU
MVDEANSPNQGFGACPESDSTASFSSSSSTNNGRPERGRKSVLNKKIMAKRYEIHEPVKKLILGHYKSGKGYKTISKIVHVKPNSVGNIVRKYKKMGTVKNLPRKGRPAKTTQRIDREIIRKVEQDRGLSAPELAKDLQTDHGQMMVWGSFAWSGVGKLEFIDGKMRKEVFADILKRKPRSGAKSAVLSRTFIFQQDGDPKHTSKLTTEWLKKSSMKMLDWVPQSTDLNPI